jgi:hypothetical protein
VARSTDRRHTRSGDGGILIAEGRSPAPADALAVGDPARPAIRRAVFGTLLVAAVFSVLTGPVKQIGALYDHAPWLNDPFDTAVSFAMFFVPLAAAFCLARVPLCRRSGPLPLARAADLLRGCRVVLGAAAMTLLAEWAAVAIGANRPQWNWATWLQVGLLALMTVLTVRAVADLHRVPAAARSKRADTGPAPDWLTDVVAIAALQSHWLGPLHGPALSALSWTERHLLTLVRRHPLWAAAIAAAAFGGAVGGNQAISEGYVTLATLLVISLLGCGMFAFLVAAGSYIGLVRSSTALHGGRRRALDAGVLACVGVLVVLAFRNSLWWVVGSRAEAAGIPQAYALLGLSALAFFVVVFAFESLRGYHAKTSP